MVKKFVGHVTFQHLVDDSTPETYWAAKWPVLYESLGLSDLFVVREYGSVQGNAHYHFYLETHFSRSTVYGKLRSVLEPLVIPQHLLFVELIFSLCLQVRVLFAHDRKPGAARLV